MSRWSFHTCRIQGQGHSGPRSPVVAIVARFVAEIVQLGLVGLNALRITGREVVNLDSSTRDMMMMRGDIWFETNMCRV